MNILADRSITVTSVNDEIRIEANEQIQFVAEQAAITLKGGDIDFTMPGAFAVHSSMHVFEGPERTSLELMRLPNSVVPLYDEAFALTKPTGRPLEDIPFKVTVSDGGRKSAALGAFASKTVACTLETWQVRAQAALMSEKTREGLGKGNFWLFCDISG